MNMSVDELSGGSSKPQPPTGGFVCTLCDLHTTRGGRYVLGYGKTNAKVAFIFESPQANDPHSGRPIHVGQSSEIFNEMLAAAGLTRDEIFLTPMVKCRPAVDKRGNVGKPLEAHIEKCFEHIDRELSFVKPKWIVLLGAAPTQFFLGLKTLSSAQNKIFDSSQAVGLSYALSGETKTVKKKIAGEDVKKTMNLNTPGVFKLVAVNSPASVARDPSKKEETLQSMKVLKDLIAGKMPKQYEYDYKIGYDEQSAYDILMEVLAKTKIAAKMTFDLETSGFYWYQRMFNPFKSTILGVAFCFEPYKAYGVTLRPEFRSPRVLDALKAVMESPVTKCGHNGKFDNLFLRAEFGIRTTSYLFDTMIAGFALDQDGDLGLDKLAPSIRPDLGRWWEVAEKTLDKEKGHLNTPDTTLIPYNCKDVDATMSLWLKQEERLNTEQRQQLFDEILIPHADELERKEFIGIKVDVPAIIEVGKKVLKEVIELEEKACSLVGRHPSHWGDDPVKLKSHGVTYETFKSLNLGSPKQLVNLLYVELALTITKRTPLTKQPTTDEEALKAIKHEHPFVETLLQYRTAAKQLSTYLGWEQKSDGTEGPYTEGKSLLAVVDDHSRVHTNFNVAGAATGRLSSSSPNLQNQPKAKLYRDFFVAEDGFSFINSDFSGLELRVIANLSRDEAMLKAFHDGVDPHSATASAMFGIPIEQITKDGKERKAGKIINFGVAYGKQYKSLAEELGISHQEAKDYLANWAKARPQASAWFKAQQAFVREHAYIVYSMNRKRPLWGAFSDDHIKQEDTMRQANNTPVQGTGSDCLSIADIRVGKRLRAEFGEDNARILLEIHDELIVECRDDIAEQVKALVMEEMRRPMPILNDSLGLDVDCSIKKKWGDGLKE